MGILTDAFESVGNGIRSVTGLLRGLFGGASPERQDRLAESEESLYHKEYPNYTITEERVRPEGLSLEDLFEDRPAQPRKHQDLLIWEEQLHPEINSLEDLFEEEPRPDYAIEDLYEPLVKVAMRPRIIEEPVPCSSPAPARKPIERERIARKPPERSISHLRIMDYISQSVSPLQERAVILSPMRSGNAMVSLAVASDVATPLLLLPSAGAVALLPRGYPNEAVASFARLYSAFGIRVDPEQEYREICPGVAHASEIAAMSLLIEHLLKNGASEKGVAGLRLYCKYLQKTGDWVSEMNQNYRNNIDPSLHEVAMRQNDLIEHERCSANPSTLFSPQPLVGQGRHETVAIENADAGLGIGRTSAEVRAAGERLTDVRRRGSLVWVEDMVRYVEKKGELVQSVAERSEGEFERISAAQNFLEEARKARDAAAAKIPDAPAKREVPCSYEIAPTKPCSRFDNDGYRVVPPTRKEPMKIRRLP